MKPVIVPIPQFTNHSHMLSVKLIVLFFTVNFSLLTIHCFSQVGISTSGANPNNSAMLDVSSSNQGVLISRMNTVQMNAIATPAEGLLIFNVDNNCYEAYVNNAWYPVSCPAPCTAPSSPTAIAASGINCSSFTAKWNTSSGATAYYLDVSTVNTFSTFLPGYQNLNVGNSTSFTVAGLNTSTSYYYQVRASSGIGCISSNSTYIPVFVTCWSCGSLLTVPHTAGSVAPVTKTVSYNTVLTNLTGSNVCWLAQNLGADNQPATVTDATDAAAGWYWKFDNKQGYKNGSSPTPAWDNTYGGDGSWVIANDPCNLLLGTGWRIPTYTEWQNAWNNGGWYNYPTPGAGYNMTGAFWTTLKLHTGGILYFPDGTLTYRGSYGDYWSNSQYSPGYGANLYCASNQVFFPSSFNMSLALTIRCIKP
jgi:hypothetical protein